MEKKKGYFSAILVLMLSGIFMGASQCGTAQKDSGEIRGLRIIYNLPLLLDGELVQGRNERTIFFYKDAVIYRTPVLKSNFTMSVDEKTGELEQKLIGVDTLYKYLVYKQNEANGYRYDSLKDIQGKKIKVDSFMAEQVTQQIIPLYSDAIHNRKLISTKKMSEEVMLEIYSYPNKPDPSFPDSIQLYFTRNALLKNIPFSFSKEADSIKGMKLYKSRLVYAVNETTKDDFGGRAKEISFEMSIIPVSNESALLELFRRAEKNRAH